MRTPAAQSLVRSTDGAWKTPSSTLIGTGPLMERLRKRIEQLAKSDLPVLVRGETGTGKEIAARMLHASGRRRSGPFVAVNCGALQATTVESELYGSVRGVFTGAERTRDGLVHQAAGGTLFLDEIGELPIHMQPALLRLLDYGEVRRIGCAHVDRPDVRIVVATNRDLLEEVSGGGFRSDFYHRLSVLTVNMPALREHLQDVGAIAEAILAGMGGGWRLSPGALAKLERHHWPGNVRELRNVLARATALAELVIAPEHLELDGGSVVVPGAMLARPTDEVLRLALSAALTASKGNQSAAARALGVSRTTMRSQMQRLGFQGARPRRGA